MISHGLRVLLAVKTPEGSYLGVFMGVRQLPKKAVEVFVYSSS